MTRRWLQSADIEIDDDSGALLVKVGDAELKVDMAEVDVSAIVAGIGGEPGGKTLKDVVAALASVANIPASPATESGNLATIAARLLNGSDSAAGLLAALAGAQASAAQASSGETEEGTNGDGPVTVIAADTNYTYHHFRIFNSGSVAGFYSFDGGVTWHYLPPACSLHHDGVAIANQAVQIKRIAGGSDLSGVFASTW